MLSVVAENIQSDTLCFEKDAIMEGILITLNSAKRNDHKSSMSS